VLEDASGAFVPLLAGLAAMALANDERLKQRVGSAAPGGGNVADPARKSSASEEEGVRREIRSCAVQAVYAKRRRAVSVAVPEPFLFGTIVRRR
jgi:hypothetical protein